jgi:small subunit ribosomal protein S6
MREYELMFVIDPRLTDEEIVALGDQYKEMIQAAGGDVWREESWGKRKLAYQINKLSEGSYMLFHIRSDHGGVFTEVEQRMRQNERVLRYLTIRTNAGRLRHRTAKEGDPAEVSETEATQTTEEEAS